MPDHNYKSFPIPGTEVDFNQVQETLQAAQQVEENISLTLDAAVAEATSEAEGHASDANDAKVAAAASASNAQAIQDATALIAQTKGAYTDTTIAAAIAAGVSALAVGDTFTATGYDVDYTGLYVIETGPVEKEIAQIKKSHLTQTMFAETTEVSRPDVALAEVDSNGKTLNIIGTDGKHRHNHKDGTIETSELADGDRLENAPDTIDALRDDFPFVMTDANNKRILGVNQKGRLYGPSNTPLASEEYADVSSGPSYATGFVSKQRLLTIGSAITEDSDFPGDGVAGAWNRLPHFAADHFDLTNTSGVDFEFRRAVADFDGMRYRGEWNPSTGPVPISNDTYRTKTTWFWHVSVSDGEFETGDRVVFVGGVTGSSAFGTTDQVYIYPDKTVSDDAFNGVFFKVLRGDGLRFYRGEWDATSGAYPSDSNLITGDTYSVSVSGTYDGVTYAYGDYLVKTDAGWRKESGSVITEVPDTTSASFSTASGYLSEIEVRRKTGSAPAYLDIRANTRSSVTARVHTLDDRKQIWLHYEDGSLNKLPLVNASGNAFAPSFDGPILTYKSDYSGEVKTYRVATEKISGKFPIPFKPVEARTNTFFSVGDSYNSRWGSPLLTQIEYDDAINGRKFDRQGVVPANVGSLDQEWILNLMNIMAEGGYQQADYLSGIVCYTLDWNNGRQEERETILRAMSMLQGLCPRLIVAGNTTSRSVYWNGSEMVAASFYDDPQKIEDEALLEEMMGGEFFNGGNYANMRKWITSDRSPRFNRNDWEPVMQMSVGDFVDAYGTWPVWTVVDIRSDNYSDLRANINEANFQGYIDDQSEITSTTDWHYYVGTGVGDATEGRTYYILNGVTYAFSQGDGVHLPAASAAYGYSESEIIVTAPNSDTSNIMNLMAYDVATELSARGWLD